MTVATSSKKKAGAPTPAGNTAESSVSQAAPALKWRYTVEEWRAEAVRRFGEHARNWAFICPACGHIQTAGEVKEAGYDPQLAYKECFGKGTRPDRELARKQRKKPGEKADCNWKSYGLFSGPVIVVSEDGTEVPVFDFAPAPMPTQAGEGGGSGA